MKTPKIKTHVLIVSRTFPGTHPKAGEKTGFIDSIYFGNKKHTIRSNYDLWKNRIDEINAGTAILSVRYWSGRPYHKDKNGIGQIEVLQLDKNSGIGVQELKSTDGTLALIQSKIGIAQHYHMATLAKNDGLSFEDFKAWFKDYDMTTPKAIIHFTKNFRY